MSSRPAPRVPAGPNSLARLADVYQQIAHLDTAFEEATSACGKFPGSGSRIGPRAHWESIVCRAQTVTSQPPRDASELLLTLGLASSYIGPVVDAVDGVHETIAKGVGAALANAVQFLLSQGAALNLPATLEPLIDQIDRETASQDRAA